MLYPKLTEKDAIIRGQLLMRTLYQIFRGSEEFLNMGRQKYGCYLPTLPILDANWANCRSESCVTANILTLTLPIPYT